MCAEAMQSEAFSGAFKHDPMVKGFFGDCNTLCSGTHFIIITAEYHNCTHSERQ